MADEPLLGKHALIMGPPAAIAEPIALELAGLGADVALTTATNDAEEAFSLRRISRGVRALGRQSMNESVDMSIGTGVQIAMRQVAKELGGLDIVVVGPDLRIDKAPEKLTDADWSRLLNTNLSAVFYACRSAYRELQGHGGHIVILSSAHADAAGAAYAAARAGVEALVAALQHEWVGTGVHVTLVRLIAEDETLAAIRNAIGP
jgi:NAD(P)-dependent dehydrogenase (short-subunit alcohol dehydrogenase family)